MKGLLVSRDSVTDINKTNYKYKNLEKFISLDRCTLNYTIGPTINWTQVKNVYQKTVNS